MLQVSRVERAAGVIRKKAVVDLHGILPGQRAFLATVDLGSLYVDESYQRKLSPSHPINADEYVAIAAGLADIVLAGNRLNTADGQHRIRQLVSMGVERHDVLLFTGVTHEKEAELYYIKNKYKKRSDAWNSFNAGLESHRIRETAIWNEIEAAGLTTPLHANADDPELTSVTVLEMAYRTNRGQTVGGIPLVKRFLRVLSKGWAVNRRQGIQKEARNVQTQRGLLAFLRANWHLNEQHIINVLKRHDAAYVNGEAALKAKANKKMRAEANYVHEILNGLFLRTGYQVLGQVGQAQRRAA